MIGRTRARKRSPLWEIARFELRRWLGAFSTWFTFALFVAVSFLVFIGAAGAFPSVNFSFAGAESVMVNSPHTLAALTSGITYFALLIVAGVGGRAIEQDFRRGTHALLFSTPVGKGAYLGGRLLAALALLVPLHASVGIGCYAGSLMPFIDARLVGPNRAMAYLQPYLVLVLPNVLFLTALFFSVGALTRRMRPVWVTAVLMFVGYIIAGALMAKLEERLLAALLDPFGGFAFERVTEYWTTAEKNAQLIPLTGALLANRLLWLAVAAAILVLTFVRFRMGEPLDVGRGRAAPDEPPPAPAPLGPVVAPHPLRLLARVTWFSFRETVRSVAFLLLLLAKVLIAVIAARVAGAVYGTPTYPVTYAMTEAVGGGGLFELLVMTVLAGEIVRREREARVDQIVHALPVPTWVLAGAQLGTLLLIGVLLHLVSIACGVGNQIARGYYHFEPGLYASDLGIKLVSYAQMAALAIFLHAALDRKAAGHLAMVGFMFVKIFLVRFGHEHKLYRYGADTGTPYSDMNGYGHHLAPWAWFNLYWSLAAVALTLIAVALWVRGTDRSWRVRWGEARRRLRGPLGATLAVTTLGFAGVGAFIYVNTNVWNRYETRREHRDHLASYERKYKRHAAEPQPLVTEVEVRFDLDPRARSLRASGRYLLMNDGTAPIPTVHVNLPDDITVHRLAVGARGAPTMADRRLGFYSFALPAPLRPGETTILAFELGEVPRGFGNGGATGVVMGNGSFIHNTWLPHIGYLRSAELDSETERRKRGLPARRRMADLDDGPGQRRSYISSDAHWVRFAATACTSADQVAIVPGRLEREWREGDRRCFAYRSDARVLNFFSVLSARYQVRRDRWKDVAIEIHHHPGHEYNVERMIRGVKDALAYCTASFSPYQHRQVRIVEFPRYRAFAQSFPGTIPYSEAAGFIARVDGDPDSLDFPYYTTAHEVAHQWWGHQLVGADVQGATLLSESLAQYAALMVMKRTYGPLKMKRFLRYELDQYLRGRGQEHRKELPLSRVENQPYVHYNKGSLAFYALADAIGEEAVNGALAALLRRWAFQGPPYPRSVDLISALRAVTPPDRQSLITDLFETITLYDLKATAARGRPLPAGGIEVTVEVAARKLRAGERGAESEVPMDDWVDVGALDAAGLPLALERRRLGPGVRQVTLRVPAGKPARAGLDPLNKLIDRKPDDNTTAVVGP